MAVLDPALGAAATVATAGWKPLQRCSWLAAGRSPLAGTGLLFFPSSPSVFWSPQNPTAATKCEGPGSHPTLFWDVATVLGGVVGKKGAGDGGSYKKHFFYKGLLIDPKTCAHAINNKAKYRQNSQEQK